MVEVVTTMVLKGDLKCSKCFRKIKKVLCKFSEIQDQVYDVKKGTVTIKVVSSSPERIKEKIICKGGNCIKIVPPPEKPPEKTPEKPPVIPPSTKPGPSTPAPVEVWVLCNGCPGGPCSCGQCGPPPCRRPGPCSCGQCGPPPCRRPGPCSCGQCGPPPCRRPGPCFCGRCGPCFRGRGGPCFCGQCWPPPCGIPVCGGCGGGRNCCEENCSGCTSM